MTTAFQVTGKDGHRYTVRTLDKDPPKRIGDELENTVVDDILQLFDLDVDDIPSLFDLDATRDERIGRVEDADRGAARKP